VQANCEKKREGKSGPLTAQRRKRERKHGNSRPYQACWLSIIRQPLKIHATQVNFLRSRCLECIMNFSMLEGSKKKALRASERANTTRCDCLSHIKSGTSIRYTATSIPAFSLFFPTSQSKQKSASPRSGLFYNLTTAVNI
jgi:hypothetical protein